MAGMSGGDGTKLCVRACACVCSSEGLISHTTEMRQPFPNNHNQLLSVGGVVEVGWTS